MNDRSPSGPPAAPNDTSYGASYPGFPGDDGFDGAYATAAQGSPYGADVSYAHDMSYADDPLFGTMPGQSDTTYVPYDPYAAPGVPGHGFQPTGSYDGFGFEPESPWNSGSYPSVSIPTQSDHHGNTDATGDNGMAATGQWGLGSPQPQQPPSQDQYVGGYDSYHTYGDYSAHGNYDEYGSGHDVPPMAPYSVDTHHPVPDQPVPGTESSAYPQVGQHPYDFNGSWDTGSYQLDASASTTPTTTSGTGVLDESAWSTGGWTAASLGTDQAHSGLDASQSTLGDTADFGPDLTARLHEDAPHQDALHQAPLHSDAHHSDAARNGNLQDTAPPNALAYGDARPALDTEAGSDADNDVLSGLGSDAPLDPPDVSPAAPHPGGRGRRRAAKPRRSALLTVAVPSVAVMGVAGIAAASVNVVGEEEGEKGSQAAPDPTSVKPSTANNKLDTQLQGVSEDAGAFADRASRTQERLDLKERQEAERKRKEAEAARKEAERPKFALPVDQPGLSAYYGQAGINWMSLHTGIDFPVNYGMPVKAATDGVVSTKYDLSYGNMVIVTAADGTETWYCHMSSAKIRGGQVKAGDTIGYSGNSGNSTGPHLHFEVRPGGGSAVDPLAWFRGKGLDPT